MLFNPQRSQQQIEHIQALVERKNMTARGRMHALWAVARTGSQGVSHWLTQEEPEQCNHAALRAELMRLGVEFLHTERSKGHPAERSGAIEYVNFEREWVNSAIVLEHVPDPVRLQALLGLYSAESIARAVSSLSDSDPFLVAAALECLGRKGNSTELLELLAALDAHNDQARARIGLLLALRRAGEVQGLTAIPQFLDDLDPGVRRAAIQWVGEERLTQFGSHIEAAAGRPPVTRELFEAFLAAKDLLAGARSSPTDEPSGEEFIVKLVGDESQRTGLRTMALRSLRPDHPSLAADRLPRLLDRADTELRLELVRTLAARSDSASQDLLRGIAANTQVGTAVRAEAVLGLAHSAATSQATLRLLLAMIDADNPQLRREAMRSLRAGSERREIASAVQSWLQKAGGSASVDDTEQAQLLLRSHAAVNSAQDARSQATELESFAAAAVTPGDASAGARVFFHRNGPQCSSCHRVNGRGGAVGPDLSVIGRTRDRDKLVRSILEPSKDIAPQYATWLFSLHNGQLVSGIILQDDPHGVLIVGDVQGNPVEVSVADIETRKAIDKSIMPEDIGERMTHGEFRDLVAFLMELK
jgi:putative heme-binding domain-containing protein